MIAIIAGLGAALIVALALPRLLTGPSLYDRGLAANTIVVQAALACAAMAALRHEAAYVDAALALLLSAVIANAAILKFFRARSFQPPLARADEDTI